MDRAYEPRPTWLIWAMLAAATFVALAAPSVASGQPLIRPVLITDVASLPASAEDGRIYIVTDAVTSADCTTGGGSEVALCAYDVSAGAYVALSGGGGGGGDITAVGDCSTGACFGSETSRFVLAAPSGGGTAGFRALVEADISDLSHTTDTDTTCNDAGVTCLFAASASEGGAASSVAADSVTLTTDTAGNYVASIANGAGITGADGGSEGAALTIAATLGTSIAPAEMADADHGDISWSAGVASVDSGAVGMSELADDLGCTGSQNVRRNAGDTAWECYTPSSGGSPGGSGTELQYRSGASTFGAVTSSSVSGANVTLGGTLNVPYGSSGSRSINWPNSSGLYGTASGAAILIEINGDTAFRFNNCTGATECFGGDASGSFRLWDEVPSATLPNMMPNNTDTNTGVGHAGGDDLRMIAGGVSGLGQTATETTLYVEQVNSPYARTCTSDGTGAPGTLAASVSGATYLALTNSDPDGCVVTLSETGATDGQRLEIVVISSAGGTVTLPDTAGVQETGAGCAMAVWGTYTLRYAVDRWVASGCRASN